MNSNNNANESINEGTANMKRVLIDLAYVLGSLLVIKTALLQVPAMWTFAGPISLLSALAVASWRLKVAGENWKSIGLFNDQSKLALASWTIGALLLTLLVGIVANALFTQLLVDATTENSGINDVMSGRFANLPGNIPVFIFWLGVAWIIGGFTEELLFRGFMIQRFEKLYQKLPFAIGLAVLTQALIFGQQHYYYQGLMGFFATATIGLFSGIIYVLGKRKLWPLILSHGLANTLGMTVLFLSAGG